jgi:hypothetical protein
MSKSRRPRQGSGRKVGSRSPKIVRLALSPAADEEFFQSMRTPPLVVDAELRQQAVEIADALAARDDHRRGVEFWNALTECAGISGGFLDSGHLNVLLSFTKNPNKNVRRYAAQAIVQVGSHPFCPPSSDEAFGHTVLAAMESDDSDVRYAVVIGFRRLAEQSPEMSGKAFQRAVRGLTDQDARIRAGCLYVLSAFGIDRVSSAVSDMKKALSDKSPQVQRSACDLLGWLEKDAIGAIDDLMKCVATASDETVRRAATLAIAKINPSGDRLDFDSGGQTLRADLIKFLRDAGAAGRTLRRNLEQKRSDDSPDSTSPPPGTESVFPSLTKKEQRVLLEIWKHRQPDGVQIAVVAKAVGWTDQQDLRKLFDVHLCAIRKKFRNADVGVSFERLARKVRWVVR